MPAPCLIADEPSEPRVERTWPLAILDADSRPMWALPGGVGYDYDLRLEAIWRRGQRWEQRALWRMQHEQGMPRLRAAGHARRDLAQQP